MRIPEPVIRAGQSATETDNDIGHAAVFFDFENIVLGVRGKFDAGRILEHLNTRGEVMIRRAYADWGAYKRYQAQLLEQAVEMVFLPTYGVRDKNRTDTAVCVDAMEILFTRPTIDTFVIVSGDSDFGVLARRLRSYGKRVLGISARSAASKILASVCHEFIFYEGLTGEALQGYTEADGASLIRRALESISASGGFQPSLLKDRMRKLDSTFSERNFGFHSFVEFVEDYPNLVELTRFDGGRIELRAKEDENRRRGRRRRGRGGRGRGGKDTNGGAPKIVDSQNTPMTESQTTRVATERISKAAGSRPRPDKAKAQQAAISACRRVLAAKLGGDEVTPQTLRRRMVEAVPTFDPEKLGYSGMVAFLRDQPDLVQVIRDGRRVRVKKA